MMELIAMLLLVIGMVGYTIWRETRPVVYLLRRIHNTYQRIATVLVPQGKKQIRWQGRTYILHQPVYLVRGKPVYMLDADTGSTINIAASKPPGITPEELDALLQQKIIKQLVQASTGWTTWVVIVLCVAVAIAGICAGMVLGPHVLGSQPVAIAIENTKEGGRFVWSPENENIIWWLPP